jgi:GalNAc5-diNAcBac-PP-undecaprenol beta-1,3-glucosyltransferase
MSLAATVLIPTHDHGRLLLRSVPSVLAQTVTELEVFVVGDGAPDETRELMAELVAADERVRFFDNPKGERLGEAHRQAALQEARGEIVCYLSDDDVWLPGHVEELQRLLAEADLAHTLSFAIDADRLHVVRIDVSREFHREVLLGGDSRIHHSITGHTMELYRRLPGGWRPAPRGTYSDLYFWQRLLSLPGTRAVSGTRPTVLHFPGDLRTGGTIDERLAEIDRWSEPGVLETLHQQLLDNVLPDRAALDEALANREREVDSLRAQVKALESALSEAEVAHAQLQEIGDSVTWRLRGRLLGVPGLRSAAKALARLAAPRAAARPGPDRRPQP